MQIDMSQNTQVLLQQVLHMLAISSDSGHCIPPLLQLAQTISGAASGGFVLLNEDQTHITIEPIEVDPLALIAVLQSLEPGLHIDPRSSDNRPLFTESSLIAPLYSENSLIGGIYFVVPSFTSFDETAQQMWDALVDAFTLVAAHAYHVERRQRAEQLTTSIVTSITDPLLVLDEKKYVLALNPAAEKVFNFRSEDARGRALSSVIQSDELMAFAEDKNKRQAEWVSNDDRTFVPRAQPVLDENGQVEGWVLMLRDITHFKKLNRNQNEFTRIVSHDLRSPLTSMQGFANMLELGLVGELNEKQAHFVEKILSGISQMTALVDNIQDAGRYDPETGFYEISRSQCDLTDIVNRISGNHLVPAEKGELKLQVSVDGNVPIIHADSNMLERALTNLVDNAIKYTPNGGTVSVKTFVEDNNIIISVADTGYGISEENQKHLFERHVRIPRQEHRKIKGSGLGLFIVKSVAQRHGGDAWVTSDEGKGSTFHMSIPLEGANLLSSESA